jgi:hypothetical protein
VKKVEISFLQTDFDRNVKIANAFEPSSFVGNKLAISSNCLSQNRALKVEKERSNMTAKYIRRKLASSCKGGLNRAASHNYVAEEDRSTLQTKALDACKGS